MNDDYMELMERLTRAEQDIKNGKETFQNFKHDDFAALKSDVHSMRKELNEKIDDLIERVSSINLTMAKWGGAFRVVIFAGDLLARKALGIG